MKKKHLMLVVLAACVLISMCVIASAYSRFHTHDLQQDDDRLEDFSVPCLVLALHESNIDQSLKRCTPFVAPAFTEAELDFVAPEARKKILNPALLETASDLTNNGSVSIYINHARIWSHVAAHFDVALVLEEDAVVLPHAADVLAELVNVLRRDNVTNFVVKLVDNFYMHSSEWNVVYNLKHHQLLTCRCRPSVTSSCSAAYLIDRTAAETLLHNAFPASMHVDVFKHHMGCLQNKIKLFQLNPHLLRMNNRPSTHLTLDVRRSVLLVKEVIDNMLHSTCWNLTAARTP